MRVASSSKINIGLRQTLIHLNKSVECIFIIRLIEHKQAFNPSVPSTIASITEGTR